MNIIRIRTTPFKDLSKEERVLYRKYKLKDDGTEKQSNQAFADVLKSLAKKKR